MPSKKIVVLYCGSSFTKHLYDKLLRQGTIPIMIPSDTSLQDVLQLNPDGIVITGSGSDPNHRDAPRVDVGIYGLDIPILGICYGMQRMAIDLGGQVMQMMSRESELTEVTFSQYESILLQGFADGGAFMWMAHSLKVTQLPDGFTSTSCTDVTEYGSMERDNLYGVQFHPEQRGNLAGTIVLRNFVAIC